MTVFPASLGISQAINRPDPCMVGVWARDYVGIAALEPHHDFIEHSVGYSMVGSKVASIPCSLMKISMIPASPSAKGDSVLRRLDKMPCYPFNLPSVQTAASVVFSFL